jgi:ribonuclease P protein component
MDFTFNKEEHLKSRKDIALLVEKGQSFLVYPIKVKWIVVPDQNRQVKCAFSVPKRNFKRAVDRNRIKRLLREAYRLHKNDLISHVLAKNVKIQILFTFIDTNIPDFEKVESKIILTLQSLIKKNEESIDSSDGNAGKNI